MTRWPFDSSSSDSIDQARFTPGTMLTGRYRIVALLGKGGMGEVYRADDLKLRQPVALKFLPQTLAQDQHRLERFLHEVRVARQVAHPNVCRVYDIAEADGHHFISMEYVDGEDLAAVLRRMGRPSKEKALQIARQLCAALAAAHDKGVLHRDLKPHNVMIDGQGRVRITDFGLAGFAEDFAGKEVYAGTPAYMAPEQLAGRGVSVKSDIYSLGLVLCELFTGKRLFEGTSRDAVQRSRTSAPSTLSTLCEDLDPAVERVILRCLEPDPTARPSSALAVAAALPGGDPLAAALAAGETPSPEMVANAGEVGGMRPAIAVICLMAILGGTLALVPLFKPWSVARAIALPKTPAALEDRAAEILTRLGHSGPVADAAHGFAFDEGYVRHVEETDKSATRWDLLGQVRPSPLRFWYRQSPRLLIPSASDDDVEPTNPPMDVSGMATIYIDPRGRLVSLAIEPPQREEDPPAPAPAKAMDWSVLFKEADLDPATFTPAEPRWTPSNYCDERVAWEGRFPDHPDVPARLEAGAYRGRVTSFDIIMPWTKPQRMAELPQTLGEKIGQVFVASILVLLVLGGALVARRNWKLRRSDRTGANRLAIICFCLLLLSWSLLMDHFPDANAEFDRLRVLAGSAMVGAAIVWLWYLALEPYVRRRWPQALISWNRLLSGRFRDPLVGRDILIGSLFALVAPGIYLLMHLAPKWLNEPPNAPEFWPSRFLLGPRFQVGGILSGPWLWFPLLILILLLAFRLLLKREWLAIPAVLALIVGFRFLFASPTDSLPLTISNAVFFALWWVVLIVVPLRFGLLASVAMWFMFPLIETPGMFGLTGWQAQSAWMALLFIAAVAGFGFYTALAGRPLFRDELLDR